MQSRTRWWWLKVGCGFALILAMLIPAGPWPRWSIPTLPAQVIAVGGGLLVLYHHRLLRRANQTIWQPARLLAWGGLYRWIRHPMYLGDGILYLGLACLGPLPVSLPLLLLAWMALYRQARFEDRLMADRFPEDFKQWQQHSGLLWPGGLWSAGSS